jgi:DNA ligase (NAD+)
MSEIESKIAELRLYDEAYFSGNPLIPDVQYDALKREVFALDPQHDYFSSVGSPVRGGKVKLPYNMGGLDQIYEGEFDKWVVKYGLSDKDLIISEKLDGVSVLLIYKNGKLSQAFSRGNGTEGADITRHIKYCNVPLTLENTHSDFIPELLVVRAEAIMKNQIFDLNYAKKYSNARQMVAGCLNRKETDSNILRHIDIVAYQLVDETNKENYTSFAESLNQIRWYGFKVAYYEADSASAHSDESLSATLMRYKETSLYELDGIVITIDKPYEAKNIRKRDTLNPEHSLKYKILDKDSILESEVVNVHWAISKSGFYKPRVEISPVRLFGTTVTFATGFNGKYIYENSIGPGAKIKLTKSGSVIPYILEVVKPANTPQMPNGGWIWDENKVEAIVSDNENSEIVYQQALHFFKTLEVEQLRESSLTKVIEYIKEYQPNLTFNTLISETIYLLDEDWKRILGANGSKVSISLNKKLDSMPPEKLLGACPFFGFGFGVRKAKKLLKVLTIDDILRGKVSEDQVRNIEGFDKTSTTFVNGINDFINFYGLISDYVTFSDGPQTVSDKLKDEVIVMTGFRDKNLQEQIESLGGRVASAVSGKTTIVITNDVNSSSSKIKKAKSMGIPVFELSDFEYEYIH